MAHPTTINTESLNSLIAVLHDGLELHEKAIRQVSNADVTQISQTMISVRRQAIDKIKPLVIQGGKEPTSRGTFAGNARGLLAKTKAMVGDTDKAYAAELAKIEDTTVSMIDTCMAEASDSQISRTLDEQKQAFREAAEKLRALSDGS